MNDLRLTLIYSFFLIKKNQKIKTYAAGAKNATLSRAERTRCAQIAFSIAYFPAVCFAKAPPSPPKETAQHIPARTGDTEGEPRKRTRPRRSKS